VLGSVAVGRGFDPKSDLELFSAKIINPKNMELIHENILTQICLQYEIHENLLLRNVPV
jgi:hypothetical protein